MILRSWRNYDVKAVSRSCGLDTGTDTKVIQSARDDADINVIVKRFNVTGMLPQLQRQPLDVDIDKVMDYRSAMQYVREAAERFMMLPSQLRERFQNDPQEFMAFVQDEANAEEAEKLGLIPKRERAKVDRSNNSPSNSTKGSTNVGQTKADAGNAPKASAGSAGADGSGAGGAGSGAPGSA